jgi:basic amino acid/polyamine antiporter, APA family
LSASERRWPRALSGLGLLGCLVLAVTLPLVSVIGGTVLLALGAIAFFVKRA